MQDANGSVDSNSAHHEQNKEREKNSDYWSEYFPFEFFGGTKSHLRAVVKMEFISMIGCIKPLLVFHAIHSREHSEMKDGSKRSSFAKDKLWKVFVRAGEKFVELFRERNRLSARQN